MNIIINIYFCKMRLYNELIFLNFKKVIIAKLIIIIIFTIISLLLIFSKINYKLYKEMKILDKYYDICEYGILLNDKNFSNLNNPKLSIISVIYNNEEYILRFLRSIQNQFFEEIEIILIDDCSTDNSTKIIKKVKERDKRIILIKHNEKKGQIMSRNIGILISKGDYIIISESEIIFSNYILNNTYQILKKNIYDIIIFNIYLRNQKKLINYFNTNLLKKEIYQIKFSCYNFIEKNCIKQIDNFFINKIIKREIYIRIIINYFNNNFIIKDDKFINIIQIKSVYFIENIGFYQKKNLYEKQNF